MDAVGPEVDIVPGRQIPLQPVRVLVRPNLGEPRHGRGRQAAGVRPEQGRQRLGEVARGDALEVEDGDQDFEALRAPRIRRQERGAEPDAVGAQARAVANAWRANRNRADAGHDLAFGQVAVAHQPSAAFFGARLGVAIKERGNLRLDRPRQQGPGAAAQHLGQRIGKRRWLGKLQNVIVAHGVSLLRWRGGGSITPTIRRLNPSPRHQLLAIALLKCPVPCSWLEALSAGCHPTGWLPDRPACCGRAPPGGTPRRAILSRALD